MNWVRKTIKQFWFVLLCRHKRESLVKLDQDHCSPYWILSLYGFIFSSVLCRTSHHPLSYLLPQPYIHGFSSPPHDLTWTDFCPHCLPLSLQCSSFPHLNPLHSLILRTLFSIPVLILTLIQAPPALTTPSFHAHKGDSIGICAG